MFLVGSIASVDLSYRTISFVQGISNWRVEMFIFHFFKPIDFYEIHDAKTMP